MKTNKRALSPKKLAAVIVPGALVVGLLIYFLLTSPASSVTPTDRDQTLDRFILSQMEQGKIPGAAVVIIENGTPTYQKGFGYSNKEKGLLVTDETLFELGSNSKAFTGLGILLLEHQGLINLADPVSKYLPWFKAYYQGREAEIKLSDCLHHTTGIPFKSIDLIPSTNAANGIEQTVRALSGIELARAPGEQFEYVTVNYDFLGLVIETVTQRPFEEFMRDQVLKPLGLNHTYVDRGLAYSLPEMATGYKLGFLIPQPYAAPDYRGNTPAGYFIADSRDITTWLEEQMGSTSLPEPFTALIAASHLPNRRVAPSPDGTSYAVGWAVYQDGTGKIAHGGSNPNFSSYIIVRPEDKFGAAVLTNIDTDITQTMAEGILKIVEGKNPAATPLDTYRDIDNIASAIFIICSGLIVITFVFLVSLAVDIFQKKRGSASFGIRQLVNILLSAAFFIGLVYCVLAIPQVMFWGLSWNFVLVWGPFSLLPAAIALVAVVFILIVYFQLIFAFPQKDERPFFSLIVLSFVSGLGNAFIIFIINEALNRQNALESGLLIFFLLGISVYIVVQRIVRTKVIVLTNELIYEKRLSLIEKILNTVYFKFERINREKYYSGLNNDTEALSELPGYVVDFFTFLITLICCFIYLGIINFYGLLLSLLIVGIGIALYLLVGRTAQTFLEQARNMQDAFFRYINDLLGGIKELSLSFRKRKDFQADIETVCSEYKDKRTRANLRFSNVIILGDLLFTLVIGAVVFLFPVILKDIQYATLRTYIFVFLYMTGPVNGMLNITPRLFQMRISWLRINNLLKELSDIADEPVLPQPLPATPPLGITLQGVEYQYKNQEGDEVFKVGPIDYQFKPGEITFITGGNGSGKTTLAKLITGLYKPDQGVISVNGERRDYRYLGENFSTVFNDFYLFAKIYGADSDRPKTEADRYLKLFHIEGKVHIQYGKFSTLDLSQGQRKRLALLVSYIDDKPIFLFDEWAADQDPEFRKYFYCQLLQDLKRKGKCVIAITHDDYYFHVADKTIKMEGGKIVDTQVNLAFKPSLPPPQDITVETLEHNPPVERSAKGIR